MKRTEYNVTTCKRTEHTLSSSEETARNTEKADNDKVAYKNARAFQFQSLGDQLDMLYHDLVAGKLDATGTWAKHIKAVKDANPKP